MRDLFASRLELRVLSVLALAWLALTVTPGTARAARHSHHAVSGAGTGGIGVGVILGEPTGFTAKFWTSERNAVDVGLAYDFNNFFVIDGDYLWHFPSAFGYSSEFVSQLDPYLGVGAVVWAATQSNNHTYFNSSAGMGIRFPLGIEWRPHYPPLGIFVELDPGLGIIPGTFGFLQGGIGARYFF